MALCLLWLCLTGMVALHAQPQPQLSQEKFNDHIDYYVQNPGFGDLTATFELKLNNARCTLGPPYTLAIPAQKKIKAFTLTPANRTKDWSFDMKYTWTSGNFLAVPNTNISYRLPYPSGEAFLVGQGAMGTFSHTGQSAFAIDWNMPEGSPVCAARDGIVVVVQTDSNVGGTNKTLYGSKANFIQVQHSDRTIGEYVHLQQGGSLVKPGQLVKTGQKIGLSGNTGYSTGPHLHFMVFKALAGSKRQSIPIRFTTAEGTLLALKQGETYTAP